MTVHQLGRSQRSRCAITAMLCLAAHLATKAWTGGFASRDRIIYPEDPNYVEPKNPTTGFFLNNTGFSPKIIWLMSFPNSGTSFTMTNIRKMTNRSIATNYADEVTLPRKSSLPLYPFHDEGPFWPGMVANKLVSKPKELPEEYILTKTHCGSRCIDCGPKEYLEDVHNFTKACASGYARIPDPTSENRKNPPINRVAVEYPSNRVHKAVHLVRSPYDNLVARFHLLRRMKETNNNTVFLEKYPNTAAGFQNFCNDSDAVFAQQEEEVFNPDLLKAVTAVPCHTEFYLYFQWHNLAYETQELLGIPTHMIHYEEYEKDFDGTVSRLLDFIQAKAEGEPYDFSPGHSYDDYFSAEQRQAVKNLAKMVASKQTLKQVERYL